MGSHAVLAPLVAEGLERTMHVMGRSNEFEEKAELISEITRAFHAKVLAPFIREALPGLRDA